GARLARRLGCLTIRLDDRGRLRVWLEWRKRKKTTSRAGHRPDSEKKQMAKGHPSRACHSPGKSWEKDFEQLKSSVAGGGRLFCGSVVAVAGAGDELAVAARGNDFHLDGSEG